MRMGTRYAVVLALALAGGVALVASGHAAPGDAPATQGGAPAVVAYQGEVRVDGMPYTGDGRFKFVVTNGAGTATYWSNDGTGSGGLEPTAAVELPVSEGLFSVLLGDTALEGMGYALSPDVFSGPDRYLRVWFSTGPDGPFHLLEPDTRIAAVPYALQARAAVDAGAVDGYEGAALEESTEIDADIAAHAAASDAHHARYTDDEAWAATLANDGAGSGLDADTVDGQEGATLEESGEIDADIAAHAAVSDAHHARYTDGEAWAAALTNDGPGSGLDADTVDGLHAIQLGGTHYRNVVVVAKSGGDYASVQAAIDSIADATSINPYLVWVAPGVYSETVTMKPHVHVQGAGQNATTIVSTIGSGAWPQAEATLRLASDVSLRDLTVGNGGTSNSHAALIATAGTTRTLVADVTAWVAGGGANHIAVLLSGSGTGVVLQQTTALAENGTLNYGLASTTGARATLRGGSFTGRGGDRTWGIFAADSGTTLDAVDVAALGEDGYSQNHGLANSGGGAATASGGSFTGRGGTGTTWGIYIEDSGTTMVAQGVTALGEGGDSYNHGLDNHNAATMTLCCGSFVGRGGTHAYGIHNDGDTSLQAQGVTAVGEGATAVNYGLDNTSGAEATLGGGSYTGRGASGTAYGLRNDNATLQTESVTALGGNASYNKGLYNLDGAVTLRGGSFAGRGGTSAIGIECVSITTATLRADSVIALAENGENYNYGLFHGSGSAAELRGGSFIGRGEGAGVTWGIRNAGVLDAEGVAALGEGGDVESYGLYNFTGAEATLRRSSFTGRDGTFAYGILNFTANLIANGITAQAEDGTSTNDGLTNSGGSVMVNSSQLTGSSNGFEQWSGTAYLGVSQLDGGATKSSGTLTCFQVYDETYTAYACP